MNVCRIAVASAILVAFAAPLEAAAHTARVFCEDQRSIFAHRPVWLAGANAPSLFAPNLAALAQAAGTFLRGLCGKSATVAGAPVIALAGVKSAAAPMCEFAAGRPRRSGRRI